MLHTINTQIENLLFEKGADIVRFVDIGGIPVEQSQGFERAAVFCMPLSKEFILAVHDGKKIKYNEFVDKEHKADALADFLAEYLQQKGYRAYSGSEKSNEKNGNFDTKTMSSKLPHKTIAKLAGIGYIGKNNLMITEKYGCAFSMCSVLTNAPFETDKTRPISSKCGDCDLCKQICPGNSILGNEWSEKTGREGVIGVHKCMCALKCMVYCPKTLKYAMQSD